MIRYSLVLFLITGFLSFYPDQIRSSVLHPLMTELFENNVAFQNLKAIGENGEFVVTGETRPANGEYFYIVEDGHNELITAKKQTAERLFPTWSKFKIEVNIPKEKLPQNGTVILYLFERNNDGKMLNILPVVLSRQGKS